MSVVGPALVGVIQIQEGKNDLKQIRNDFASIVMIGLCTAG